MALYDRLKVAAVMWVLLLLTVGVVDAFVDTLSIRDLVMHSSVFWVMFTAAGLVVAPYVTRLFPLERSSRNTASTASPERSSEL